MSERRQFEKLSKKAKRSYQLSEQQRLMILNADNNTREVWREIGKLGFHNERKIFIPMEVVDTSGNISTDEDIIVSKWEITMNNYFPYLMTLLLTTIIYRILNVTSRIIQCQVYLLI